MLDYLAGVQLEVTFLTWNRLTRISFLIYKKLLYPLPKDKLPVSSKKDFFSFMIAIAVYIDKASLCLKNENEK